MQETLYQTGDAEVCLGQRKQKSIYEVADAGVSL